MKLDLSTSNQSPTWLHCTRKDCSFS